MTWLGLIHLLLVTAALAIGAAVLLAPKGTRRHRTRGRVFVLAMLLSNVIVFGIYEDSPRPGVFHYLAIVSLASLAIAVMLVRQRRGLGRRILHGHVMLWSYGGLIAAGLGQGATILGFSPWPAILGAALVVAVVAARLDFRRMAEGRPMTPPVTR